MASPADIILGNVPPEQDYIVLGGMQSPGRATISGLLLPRKWDVRQGYGYSGATAVWMGEELIRFDVTIDLWLPEHWGEWNRFASKTIVRKTPGRPKALAILHPLLNIDRFKITSVVVENVSHFEQDEEGLWSCKISFLQYREPLPVLVGKVDATIPDAERPRPIALEKADEQLGELLSEFWSLSARLGL